MDNTRICAVVPVFNPEPGLLPLVEALKQRFGAVVVVDDGSSENITDFEKLPAGVVLLRHPVNRGKGRAIKTALEWCVAQGARFLTVVFADGDGQHLPEDVERVAVNACKTSNVTFGVRDFLKEKIPFRSRFGNLLTAGLVRIFFGIKIGDTQTGLRAIPQRFWPDMITLPGERYEYEMRLFGFLHRQREALEQIPIATVYLENNRASHFRPVVDSIKIYRGLFGDAFAKFCASSLLGFLVDNLVFTASHYLLHSQGVPRRYDILISLLVARSISATLNYACNRTLVFRSQASVAPSFVRYAALVVLIAALSYAGTATLSAAVDALGVMVTAIKILVETALFILSYRIQKKWVFKGSSRV